MVVEVQPVVECMLNVSCLAPGRTIQVIGETDICEASLICSPAENYSCLREFRGM